MCHGCRFDADPARSAEVTARFATSKAAAAAARLRPPLTSIVPGTKRPGMPGTASDSIRLDDACSCTATVTCAPCLITRAAEAAHGRRVAHDYLDTCATSGRHHDLDAIADCPHPSATIAPPAEAPVFCVHARPREDCVVHAPYRPQPAMPAKLARCGSCLGFHGKTGYDRCPYTRQETAAVKERPTVRKALRLGRSAGTPSGSPDKQGTSGDSFVTRAPLTAAQARLGAPGRLRTHTSARDRQRAYRVRKRGTRATDSPEAA